MILLTGGTGIVGHELIAQFTQPKDILALAREIEKLPDGVTPLSGDLQQPGLGLENPGSLSEVEVVIHMAANTRWNLADEDALNINTLGTQQLINVVKKHCPKLKHFIFVSTAFVDETSHTKEMPHLHRDNYNNSYEFSKAHAEDAVRNSELPYSIVRPSIIIGRSYDGYIVRSSGIYQLFQLFFSGHLPAIVGYEDSRVDMVPVDDVAAQIIALSKKPATQQTYYVSSDLQTPTIAQILSCLQKELHQDPLLSQAVPQIPNFVKPDTFERFFLPMIEKNTHLPLRKYLEIIKYFKPYLAIRTHRNLPEETNLATHYQMEKILTVCFRAWIHRNARKLLAKSDRMAADQTHQGYDNDKHQTSPSLYSPFSQYPSPQSSLS